MSVRSARPDDLDEICELIRELAVYEKLEDEVVLDPAEVNLHLFGDRPVASVLLAEEAGEVAGFAVFFPSFSTFLGRPGIWLEDLFVRPEFRGKGHGRALIEALRARTGGRLEWDVLDWNESAISFYESLGAEAVRGWTKYRWLPSPGAVERRT